LWGRNADLNSAAGVIAVTLRTKIAPYD